MNYELRTERGQQAFDLIIKLRAMNVPAELRKAAEHRLFRHLNVTETIAVTQALLEWEARNGKE